MLTNVNPTRMEALRLRRRVSLAARGHKLLSEKRDEISRQLLRIASEIGPLRKEIETLLVQSSRRFVMAKSTMEPGEIAAAMDVPTKKFNLAVKQASIMSVKVPQMQKEVSGDIICYGYGYTSCELDVALKSLERAFDKIVELAQKEKQARLLAGELQMTRRRVNVLEHVVIPELNDTIKYIYGKLAEAERDNISRLMKITDIIRKQN